MAALQAKMKELNQGIQQLATAMNQLNEQSNKSLMDLALLVQDLVKSKQDLIN